MRRWHESKRTRARIEIIPMIDVMMFLLVFFVLISINVIPALGLKTKLPRSSQTHELVAPVRVIITLGKDGELLIDGAKVTLDRLAGALRERQGQDGKKLTVVINGDDSASLQQLINVMDVVKEQGLDSLSIAAKKKQN